MSIQRKDFTSSNLAFPDADKKALPNISDDKKIEVEKLVAIVTEKTLKLCLQTYETYITHVTLTNELQSVSLASKLQRPLSKTPNAKQLERIKKDIEAINKENDETFVNYLQIGLSAEIYQIIKQNEFSPESINACFHEAARSKLAEFQKKRKEIEEAHLAEINPDKKSPKLPDSPKKQNPFRAAIQETGFQPSSSSIAPVSMEETTATKIQNKLTTLFSKTSLRFQPIMDNTNPMMIQMTGSHEDIRMLVKLVTKHFKFKQKSAQYKKENKAEFVISGNDKAILSLLSSNTFVTDVSNALEQRDKEKSTATTSSAQPSMATTSQSKNDNNTTTPPVLNITSQDAETWIKLIHSAFCFANEITINWDETQKCFIIDLPSSKKWQCVEPKGKLGYQIVFYIPADCIENQIVSRLNSYLPESLAKVEMHGNQLKITPYVPAPVYSTDLHVDIYNYLFSKNPDAKAQQTTPKEKQDKKEKTRPKPVSPPLTPKDENLSAEKVKEKIELFLALLVKKVSDKPYAGFVIGKTKSKKWCVKLVQGAESIHVFDSTPIDSVEFLKTIEKYFAPITDFIKFYSDPPRLIIDANKLDEAMQKLPTLGLISDKLNLSNDKAIAVTGTEYLKEEVKQIVPDENVKSSKEDVMKLMMHSFTSLNKQRKKNLVHHLKELELIPTPQNPLTPECEINYRNFLLHVLELVRLISSGTHQKDNVFNDWRNIIHHASTKLQPRDFYNLMHPFVVLIKVLFDTENLTLFAVPSKKSLKIIQALSIDLYKFKDDLANGTLGEDVQISVLDQKTYLTKLLNNPEIENNVNYQKAALMTCSLIGKATREEPYLTIRKSIGHLNLSAVFQTRITHLFQTHYQVLRTLHHIADVTPKTSVR